MTITNPRTGAFANYQQTYTGDPARFAFGQALQQSFLHLRYWRASETIATYIGRPDENVNGYLSNGAAGSEDVGTFYIISAYPPTVATQDRQLLIMVRRWLKGYADGTESWTWYNTIGGAADALFSQPAVSSAVTDDDYDVLPNGNFSSWLVDVTPTTNDDGFKMSSLECTRVLPAVVQVCAAPGMSTVDATDAICRPYTFGAGQTLRGYDTTAGDSVGALAHYTNNATDGVIQTTRRCLFQTPYILGAYQENTAETDLRKDSGGNPYYYRVLPRNLDGGAGDITCDVALCLTADAGVVVKLVSYETVGGAAKDTWTYTVPGGGVAAALITTSDGSAGLDISSGAANYVRVLANTSGALTCRLHTVSLWEPRTGSR